MSYATVLNVPATCPVHPNVSDKDRGRPSDNGGGVKHIAQLGRNRAFT